jgi:tagatose 6-phosphate kinase
MILCIGATPAWQRVMILPNLAVDQPNRASRVLECSAGKAINVARVLRTLGESCFVTGFLGGHTGDSIRRDLDANHIPHQFATVVPATRLCVTVIDEANSTATELVENPQPVAPADWEALRAVIRDAMPTARLLVLSGSLPPGAPDDFYADCVRGANSAGIRTICDARGEPLRRALPYKPFIVKPNRAELAETVGHSLDAEIDLRSAIQELLASGPTWAVITLGADGCLISDGSTFWRLKAPRVRPVSAVGSGDSFTAGLAASISRGLNVPQAAVHAAACGASNALNPLPGHVKMEEVQRLERDIELFKL